MLLSCKSKTLVCLTVLLVLSSCGTNNSSKTSDTENIPDVTDNTPAATDNTPETTDNAPAPTDSTDNTTTSTPTPLTSSAAPGSPFDYPLTGNEIVVGDEAELLDAISNAKAGDVITAVTGLFELSNKVRLDADGSIEKPIIIRAADTRKTEITFSPSAGAVEGFVVRGSHWIVDGFVLKSDCTTEQHDSCEHAFHVKSGADGLWIRNNQIIDFNAAVKGSGSDNNYADNVRIEHNEIFNTSVRMTDSPITPIDVNGGDGWLVYKNRIFDFSRGLGSKVSYGAFLKANSSNGIFDSNWVQCEKDVFAPGARIGLSFGGGGNKPIDSPICKDSDCSHLHRNGRMTNNFISHCSDLGIYINASSDTLLDHNTLYQTSGIDVRYTTSTTTIVANLLVGGKPRERDGGQIIQDSANLIETTDSVSSLPQLLDNIKPHTLTEPNPDFDICGDQRQSPFSGAIGGSTEEQAACLSVFY